MWQSGVVLLASLAWSGALLGQGSASTPSDSVTVTVDASATGTPISPDFLGLSFETRMVSGSRRGVHFFDGKNRGLVSLFRALGIRSLRIGGNTVDRADVPVPDSEDVNALFDFAQAAGLKVIYTVRLKGMTDPAPDVRISKYITDHYSDLLQCLEIGNEPNVYIRSYGGYRGVWKRFYEAIMDGGVTSNTMFCGPGTTKGGADWVEKFARDFAHTGQIRAVTQHFYLGSGQRVPNAAAALAEMLSPDLTHMYTRLYERLGPLSTMGLEYRLEEAGSFYRGGVPDVSNAAASALWGLDFMYWWALHRAAGVNFHTVKRARGQAGYSPFTPERDSLEIQPLAYAMKAFSLGSVGRLVPTALTNEGNLNVTAYAVVGQDRTLNVTIINKEYGPHGSDANVTISAGDGYRSGRIIFLRSPGGSVGSTVGITLGGAGIANDGEWHGSWTDLKSPSGQGPPTVTVRAGTAAVIVLSHTQ